MRKTLLLLISLFITLSSIDGNAQKRDTNHGRVIIVNPNLKAPLTPKEEALIKEVYQDQFNSQVLNNAERLRNIKDILRNRVEIQQIADFPKEVKMLSEVTIFNKYNTQLSRKRFDKDNFNPLSYNFDFFSNSTQIYRVDNTDYYIVIKSQYQ